MAIKSCAAARWKASGAQLTIETLRPAAKDHFVARLEGVGDRDAEQLTNLQLYVHASSPPAGDGSSITPTWCGLAAVTRRGCATLDRVASGARRSSARAT